jgi:hypothetical protein
MSFAYGPGDGHLNLRQAATPAWRGITAILQDKPYLVIDKDENEFLLEDQEGNTIRSSRFQSWQPATEMSRLVAATRLAQSPLRFLARHSDFIVGTLAYDGDWGVRVADSEFLLPIDELVDALEEANWKEGILRISRLSGTFTNYNTGEDVNFYESEHQAKDAMAGSDEYWQIDGDDGNIYFVTNDGQVLDNENIIVGHFDPIKRTSKYIHAEFDAPELESEDPIVCPNCGSHTYRALGVDKNSQAELLCLRCGTHWDRPVLKNPQSSVKEGMRPFHEKPSELDTIVHDVVKQLGLPRISLEQNNELYERVQGALAHLGGNVPHKAIQSSEYNQLVKRIAEEYNLQSMDAPGDMTLPPAWSNTEIPQWFKDQLQLDLEISLREGMQKGAPYPENSDKNAPDHSPPGQSLPKKVNSIYNACMREGNGKGDTKEEKESSCMAIAWAQYKKMKGSATEGAAKHAPGTRVEIKHPSSKGQKGSILKHRGTDSATEEETYDVQLDNGEKREGLRDSDISRIKSAAMPEVPEWEGDEPHAPGEAPVEEQTQGEGPQVIQWRQKQLVQEGVPEEIAAQVAEQWSGREYIDWREFAQAFVPLLQQGASPEQAFNIVTKRLITSKTVENVDSTENNFIESMTFEAAPIPGGPGMDEPCQYCGGSVDPTSHICMQCGAMQPEMLQQQPNPYASPRRFMGAENDVFQHDPPGDLPSDPYDPDAQDFRKNEEMEPIDQDCPMCGGTLSHKGDLGARSHFQCGSCKMWFSRANQDEVAKWDYDNDPDNLFGQDAPGKLPSQSSVEPKFKDSQGNALSAGKWYVMHGEGYKVPDLVRILNTEENHVEAAIESDVNGAFPIHIKGDEGYSFEPYEDAPKKDKEVVIGNWKIARKAFSPSEQRALVDEAKDSRARNFDKLDLDGTHYVIKDDNDIDFLWS